jgi:hypothetical protein
MKSSRKQRPPDTYRENHLNQMKKKITTEFIRHSKEEDSRLTILQILTEMENENKKGDK